MKKSNVDLMVTYWTTSGVMTGEAEISRFSFKDRVEAASKAGLKGIGLWHTDLEHILKSSSLKEMKMIMDDFGLEYPQVEFLTDWFMKGEKKQESDRLKKKLFEASAELGATHVKVGDFYERPCSIEQAAEGWAALCKDGQEYGATIGFEFMLCSMLNNFADALKMVEMVGAKNGGLIIDIIQIYIINTFGKGPKTTFEEISRTPIEHLVCVELDDAALEGSPLYDPTRERRWLGEGDFDIKGFISAIKKTGYKGPWALEIYSKELSVLPLQELNNLAYNTTISYFE